MKIALTGATGFIGKVLLQALSDKYGNSSITVISSRKIPKFNCILYENNKIHTDAGKINCDILIHAGAYTPKSSVDGNNIEACNSNVLFTQSLLANLNANTCNRIINISTLDVYAKNELISESSRLDPSTLYGMSKLYCEKMIHSYAVENNIKALTLRVGHTYGPGEESYKKILPVTIAKIINENPVEIWGDGEDLRSFIHVEDVVQSILTAIQKNIDVDIINLVSSNKISIKNLVAILIQISNKDIQAVHLPSSIPRRDLVFDNTLLKKNLLLLEKNFMMSLKEEYDYMVSLNEHNI